MNTKYQDIETALPASIDAEKTILGAILLEGALCNEALQLVGPNDFYLESHRQILNAMVKLSKNGQPIDILTVTNALGKSADSIGGAAYVASLIDGVPHQRSVEEYAKIVRDRSRSRDLISAANGVITKSMDGNAPDEVLGELQQQVSELVARGYRRTALALPEVGLEWLNELHAIRKIKNDVIGLTTAIPELDKITTGIRQSELWVIGARPAVGKSALGRQIALANAMQGKRVVIFTLEMTAKQVLSCSVAAYGQGSIPFYKLRDPRELTDSQLEQVQEWTAEVCKLPLVLDETGNLTASDLVARARLHATRGADLFVVDYLQRMRGEARQTNLERVAAASNAVCELAKSTGVPVIALSQLRKAPNGQEDREPTADDLKETGEIYQDAATCVLLHRPVERQNHNVLHRPALLLVPKQRFGDSDVRLELTFNKRTLTFQEQWSN
ncbi:MAG: DnaB [Acidobacteriales bacterium]|nr:DnaB [Terriglobales bacterium]